MTTEARLKLHTRRDFPEPVHSMSRPRGRRGWDPRKQSRPEGWARAQPYRNRPRDPWRARSKLATERVMLSKLPLESLKNTHGNMTHCPLPMAPLSWFL